jgi:oligoribonuclease NrnB/cAMP/cGMP phosphodiesterase (DHH superfamily)
MLCAYHADCVDGLVSAWVVSKFVAKEKIEDIRYVPCEYKGVIPEVIKGETVLIVDFSFDPEVLVEMCKTARTVVLIDHHESAIRKIWEYFDKNPIPRNLDLRLNEKLSGAGGTWNFLFPSAAMPVVVAIAQDWDLWQFKYPNTRQVIACIKGKPQEFETLDWVSHNLDEAIAEGQPLVDKEDEMIAFHIENAIMVVFDGYDVPMANVPRYIHSLVAHELAEGHPFCITYFDNGKVREFSLRSSRETGIVINKIAEKYGGGGHPHAAGFRKPLPNPLEGI